MFNNVNHVIKKNKWHNEEAKEQFSPVSVMDFPSTDGEEVSSPEEIFSPFQSRLDCMEGSKKKLMQRLRRFESLAKLEPMNLSKKFTISQQTDESVNYSSPTASVHNITIIEEEVEVKEENESVHKALSLLNQIEITSEKYRYDWENILFDFFVEGVGETNDSRNNHELVFEAMDWMEGKPREMFLGWEDEKNRPAYMKDMEINGDWSTRNIKVLDEHKKEVAFELEVDVLALIIDQLVADLTND